MTFSNFDNCSRNIHILPDELLIYIFKWLPVETLICCENVSVKWQKLARDRTLWKPLVFVYSGKPGQTEVSKKNLEIISSHSELVYAIKIQYVYSYPLIKSVIDQCKNLISLELIMCRIEEGFVSDILKWPRLKKLNLKNSILILNETSLLLPFDKLKDLQCLSLSDFGLYPTNWDGLLQCRNLSQLFIDKIRNLTLDFVTELIIAQQNVLETFHIYGLDCINNNSIQLLSNCPRLKDLAIIRCEKLTDVAFLALASLKSIESLQLWNNSNFSEKALLATLSTPKFKKLRSLSLSKIQNVTPVVVDLISEYYKNLKFLALYQCPRIIDTDYEKQLKSKFRNIDVVLY
ncbi:S-phase kinase-associated protein 2-like [Melitaea cinxia]|uniref:S-phase kinase-associated protein 2-like n=1 Tax=Melitaea cinxia TaxID=113334 RepID=UPI001E270EF4|nr:S-phase kinase-associated protein 2-like [Melitaea cinxia]XP_045449517.1 S-phase kinase-associated protein 2-like [Melitaea cinxia]